MVAWSLLSFKTVLYLLDLLLQEISIEKVHILHQNGYKANRVASNNFNYSEFDSI